MARKSKPKTFGQMVVAGLDERIRVKGKLLSKRELILMKLVQLARDGNIKLQKLVFDLSESPIIESVDKPIPEHPGVAEAIARAARGEPPTRK